MAARSQTGRREAGFTLMELVVVLFIVALLAALAVPSVSRSLRQAEETALSQNLAVMRKAIDDYRADRDAWPENLSVLVDERYIRFIPDDPVADEESAWAVTEAADEPGVRDVRSTSSEIGLNGIPYNEW